MVKSINLLGAVLACCFFSFFPFGGYSQCADPELITETSILEVTNPWQLTFLNIVPKNKVDSMVIYLLENDPKNLKDYSASLRSLAATASPEAFQFFYSTLLHRPTAIDDMNQMLALSSITNYYSGARLLDEFFLNNRILKTHGEGETGEAKELYRSRVLMEAAKKVPPAYFCRELAREFTPQQMKAIIDAQYNEYIPCENPIPVTKANILEIHNPYEFTFLHKAPQNLTDSCILRFVEGPFDAEVKPMLERMAASKAHETYLLLYACITVMNDFDLYTNHFHHIANQILIWGGMEWMNEYYWNHAVKKSDNWFKFRQDIYDYCKTQNPEMFYCNQLTEKELYDDFTKDINFHTYDKKIVQIIKRNSNTHRSGFADRIENEVRQLPFVNDVNWERCFEKNCIYPIYFDLTVKIYVGDKIVERNYSMNGAEFKYFGLRWKGKGICGFSRETNDHKLVLTGIGNSPGFMDKSRAYCKKKEEERKANP